MWQHRFSAYSRVSPHIAIGPSDNIYLADVNQTTFNVILEKITPSGDSVWQESWGGCPGDFVRGVSVDPTGSIFITGYTQSCGPSNGKGYIVANLFLLKFNSTGSLVWQRFLGDQGFIDPAGLALDSFGNIYVTGSTPGGTATQPIASFLSKFNSSGILLWQRRWGINRTALYCGQMDRGSGVGVDGQGNAYVLRNHAACPISSYLMKFGSTGNLLWQILFPTSLSFAAYDGGIAVNVNGTIYMTGSASSSPPYSLCALNGIINTTMPSQTNQANTNISLTTHVWQAINQAAQVPSGNQSISGTGASVMLSNHGGLDNLTACAPLSISPLAAIAPLSLIILALFFVRRYKPKVFRFHQ